MKRQGRKGFPFYLIPAVSSLIEGIKYQPAFIKPNIQELEDLAGKPVQCEGDVVSAVKGIAGDQVATAMVSLGAEGAVVIHEGNADRIRIPKVVVKNPVAQVTVPLQATQLP